MSSKPSGAAALARCGDEIRPLAEPALVKIDIEGAEFAIPDQIAALSGVPGVRVFLSLHPPFAPADASKDEIMAALEGFDIYDARLEPVTRETVSARLHSRDPKPGWGTVFGNFFEVALVPRGEPLRKVRGPRGPMAASA